MTSSPGPGPKRVAYWWAMGLDQPEIEGEAEYAYRMAGVDTTTAAPPIWLAEQLLGPGCVVPIPYLRQSGGGALVRVNGQARIYYRCHLPLERRSFVIAHELAHWCLGQGAGDELETERACDALAAALLTPRPAFLRAVSKHGARFTRLARAFATTESLVALRFGETTFEPLALVAPRSIRVRGAAYSWPSEPEVRALAVTSKPGLRKAVLKDDSRRTTLMVCNTR